MPAHVPFTESESHMAKHMVVAGTQLPVDFANPAWPPLVPVDHTSPGPVEPPPLSIPRLLYFGLGKIIWGIVCFLLSPVQFVARRFHITLPVWLQTPAETLPRLLFRILPFLWAISDHFMGSYLNMYYSQS